MPQIVKPNNRKSILFKQFVKLSAYEIGRIWFPVFPFKNIIAFKIFVPEKYAVFIFQSLSRISYRVSDISLLWFLVDSSPYHNFTLASFLLSLNKKASHMTCFLLLRFIFAEWSRPFPTHTNFHSAIN